MWPKTALLNSCLFATAASLALAFAFLSRWPSGKCAMVFFKQSAADRPLDRGKFHLHAALHTQRPTTSDPMPDFSLLSFHSPLQSLTSVSRAAGEVDLLAGACVAQNGFTEELFVCDSCLSCVGICISFPLAKRQTCYNFFEAECCRQTFRSREIPFACGVAYPKTHHLRPHA